MGLKAALSRARRDEGREKGREGGKEGGRQAGRKGDYPTFSSLSFFLFLILH